VMAVSVHRGSVRDSIFSFDDSAARDAFIQRLQVRWSPLMLCA
jgi:hypothetical protein